MLKLIAELVKLLRHGRKAKSAIDAARGAKATEMVLSKGTWVAKRPGLFARMGSRARDAASALGARILAGIVNIAAEVTVMFIARVTKILWLKYGWQGKLTVIIGYLSAAYAALDDIIWGVIEHAEDEAETQEERDALQELKDELKKLRERQRTPERAAQELKRDPVAVEAATSKDHDHAKARIEQFKASNPTVFAQLEQAADLRVEELIAYDRAHPEEDILRGHKVLADEIVYMKHGIKTRVLEGMILGYERVKQDGLQIVPIDPESSQALDALRYKTETQNRYKKRVAEAGGNAY